MRPPLVSSWLNALKSWLFGRPSQNQRRRENHLLCLPRFEQLEDRVVPATVGFPTSVLTPTVYLGDLVAVSTVTLSNPAGPATVHYATANGSAIAGTDYSATSGNLSFQPGQTSQQIDVPILGPIGDPNATFLLTLSSPTGATLGVAVQTITFTVASPVNLANPGSQSNYDGDTVSFATSASDSLGHALTYSDVVNGSDTLPPGLSIDPNSGVISGTVASNADANGPYTVTITASDSTAGVSASETFNWGVSQLTATAHTFSAGEDQQLTLTAAELLAGCSAGNLTISVGSDPSDGFIGTNTGASGGLAYTPELGYLGPDSFQYTISSPGGATATAQISINVVPLIFFQPATTAVDQGTTITVAVDLSQASSQDVTVHYATADGGAVAGTDYTAATGQLTIPAGQTSASFTVATLTNAAASTDENFSVVLSDPSGGVVARTSKREFLTVDAAPDGDPTEELNTLAGQVDGLLTTIDGKVTAIDNLINGAGGLVAIRSAANPIWSDYDTVFGTLELRLGEAVDAAESIQEKLQSAVSKSQGELFRFEGVVQYLHTLDAKLATISDMVETEQANVYAQTGQEKDWEAFQLEITRIDVTRWDSTVLVAHGPGAVPGDAPATVEDLNGYYVQIRADWEGLLDANRYVDWYVAAMNRWVDGEQLETDPSYGDLVGDMANVVPQVSAYSGGPLLNDENVDISAAAQLGAAKGTDGFAGDSFARRGLQAWGARFQAALQWEVSLVQGQINFLVSEGYGGSANAETFGLMQSSLEAAYNNVQDAIS